MGDGIGILIGELIGGIGLLGGLTVTGFLQGPRQKYIAVLQRVSSSFTSKYLGACCENIQAAAVDAFYFEWQTYTRQFTQGKVAAAPP